MKNAWLKIGLLASVTASGLLLGGCASTPPAEGQLIADPYENTNRAFHSFNKGADRYVIRPLAQGYAFAVPGVAKHLIRNELNYLKLPGIFLNRLLQGNLEEAGAALGRFALNTTLGAAGLLDPATEFGLPHTPTDFGVTLAEWGQSEGVYLEPPLLGPHTTRHLVGRAVNVVLDPAILLTFGVIDVTGVVTAVDAARVPVDIVASRQENMELLDGVLYESQDSYVAARSGYVQLRRRQVAGGASADQVPDIFEE